MVSRVRAIVFALATSSIALPMPVVAQDGAAADPALDPFLRHPQFIDVKISPDGKYIAASVLIAEDTGGLVIIDRQTKARTGDMRMRGRTVVYDFDWVNDERIVLSVAEKDGAKSLAFPTGELYATDWNGKRQEILVGIRAGDTGFTKIKSRQTQRPAFARLVDTLRDDDKHVLISVQRLGSADGAYPTLERMAVYGGARNVIAAAPVLNARFVLDAAAKVRFAYGNDTGANSLLYYRPTEEAKWELLNDSGDSGRRVTPLGFSADGKRAYLQIEEDQGPDAIYTFDIATRERKRLLQNPVVDPLALAYTHDGSTPYGVYFMDGKPAVTLLNGKLPEALLLKQLLPAFEGEWVEFTSFTQDGSEAVFEVGSDRGPSRFFLLDANRQATYLLGSRDWIDAARMAEMKPVSFKTRDGLTVHGYLTTPHGAAASKLPMVVLPHGGPHGVRDYWHFEEEVQLLAKHGYAVLQVNFRGSGGYGRQFETRGYRQWGRTMQDDLTDATKWAIAEGVADAGRICIYGASYGGYAALMGAAREPDLYRCAIGYVGVYDLPTMSSNPGWYNSDTSASYRSRYLGANQAELRANSPANLADAIKVPVFLIAGSDDKIAPIAHSEKMRDALEKAGRPPEWMVGEREGHGFQREENRRELYTRLLKFLAQHIGKGVAANSAAPVATASDD